MFCKNCGTKLPEQGAFCPTCGTKKITEQADEHVQNAQLTPNASASHAPIPNAGMDRAVYGALTVHNNMLNVNGKVYAGPFSRKTVNRTFQSSEITVSIDQLRGVAVSGTTILYIVVGIVVFFILLGIMLPEI